jgi:hypothetical protein
MIRLIKRLVLCLTFALILFFVLALWSGGDEFRRFGEKSGGAIRKGAEQLGEKADAIREARDKTVSRIKKLSGSGEEGTEDVPETPKKKMKESESGKEKEDDSKSVGESLRLLWHSIRRAVGELTK